MVLLSRLGCFVCSGDDVFLSRIIDPAAGVLAPFRARACRPFRAPAPHTYIQVLRGWGLPPSPFKGGLGTICVLMGWRGSSRGWAWHTLVLGFQKCLQIEYLNGFGAILGSRLAGTIWRDAWRSKLRSGSSPIDKIDVSVP